ncbi:hypothetical protein SKAU_G00029210 [Synaphobranchus kaupii]|uniref:Uncharacterized protein n=1 Tax=Synaphobranchus kaupii TaxID=118154 RepID=A0A9Q1GEK1_SYNKA|nr:hypothetical protein SKAU_G00029210 [Synaphobranchus kaupii]
MPRVPVTSISNEVGQILISVLTAQEGLGLDQMVSDLIMWYTQAGMASPQLLYVDCGCCVEASGESKLKTRFSGWPDLVVRLDIYRFMRRLAGGCTIDAHHLYPTFMASLSVCIFEWDPADVALLRVAKREQLRQEGVPAITDYLKRHVKCIQDLPGVHLDTETGKTTTKEPKLSALHVGRPEQVEPAATTQKRSAFLRYSGDLVQCINMHSAKVFGWKFVPSFHSPTQYTGELIGVEYLLRQTGKPMQDMDLESEDTDELPEDLCIEEEQEDEGFQDYALDPTVASLEDLTAFLSTATTQSSSNSSVHPAPALSALHQWCPGSCPVCTTTCPVLCYSLTVQRLPRPPLSLPQVPVEELRFSRYSKCLDEHCMPGMEQVDRLADFLVGLRKQTSLVISNQDTSTIIALWKDLLLYDQAKVVFSARHQDKLKTGRFRTTKQRAEFTPGVECPALCHFIQ